MIHCYEFTELSHNRDNQYRIMEAYTIREEKIND